MNIKICAFNMRLLILLVCFFSFVPKGYCFSPDREYYELRIYHLQNKDQEGRVDSYLKMAFLPALHRAGITRVGVFKPIGNDTSSTPRIYLLIPFRSFEEKERLSGKLKNDKAYLDAGKDYLDAPFDQPSYIRIESILLHAFPDMPVLQLPALSSPRNERIYELRSYEGPTEKLYENKVKMFNEGGEVKLFKRLGFNAIFYAETIVGSRTPNLMYMTSFENKSSHDDHWKAFGEAPEWKKLSAMSEYQHNVSKSDIFLLYPTEYSDI